MNTCKNCKWWKKKSNEKGICDFVNTIYADKGTNSFEVFADAADDTDLSADIITGLDFSCIHFKKKGKN